MESKDMQIILDAGRALGGTVELSADGRNVIVVPEGYKAEAVEALVERYLPAPRRKKVLMSFTTPSSFISYVGEHKVASTRIFVTGDKTTPQFTAYIDFHSKVKTSWNEHVAKYACEPTEEWKAWCAMEKKPMNQQEFAEFIEVQQSSIIEPPGAALLELITTLEAKVDVNFNSAIKLHNGKVKLGYVEDVAMTGGGSGTQQGQIEIPTHFVVGVQPFEGLDGYKIKCRLKYRVGGGKVTFHYEMVDRHLFIKDAVKGIEQKIVEGLGIVPYRGQLSVNQ